MDLRNEFISEWLKRERPLTELSREYGISRKAAYKWLHRFQQNGRAGGLAARIRAPHYSPQVIAEHTANTIVAE